jgi:hypothetical protein
MSNNPDTPPVQEPEPSSDARADLERAEEGGHEHRLELLERLHGALEGELDVDETGPAGR